MSLPPIIDDLIIFCKVHNIPADKIAEYVDLWNKRNDLKSLRAISIPCPLCFLEGNKDSEGLYQLGFGDDKQEFMKCHTCKSKIPITDKDNC
ncbi:hypothetical protein ICV01_06240 [Polynucleobacter sp. MWH-Spelu-300-X4]|uniref:hypothetical protein n=1 Tax=Polynucleobacter sp. MWH-Spelu-300-X4 TaxID=2689109 RepID=UPI001BFE3473|nr:hypothetical protein [Polynucleobacter sp. MWH-Spelu-300-X4]QWD79247.1 hypothetical protein ICV01_06240 [Polynucleobacter sp. MWH-Spelu-300-X4]